VSIAVFAEAEVPADLRSQVLAMQNEAWPAPDTRSPESRVTHDPNLDPLSMLLVDGDRVLAALDILSKPLVHAGRGFRAGGLSTVVVRSPSRGMGFGRTLVAAAHDRMATDGFDLGLFTCDRPLRPFYELAGWRELPGTVIVGGTPQDPFPSDRPGLDKVTMADFFSTAARVAQDSFTRARIGLYPGEIDRLW
jgi:aminoglycoside 2'-N-acetyltransferase I